ncbi:hypothetical protein ACFW9F_05965 [Streptomyces sp. NPDC059506]
MATLVCGAALVTGHRPFCIALWSPAERWPLVTDFGGQGEQ